MNLPWAPAAPAAVQAHGSSCRAVRFGGGGDLVYTGSTGTFSQACLLHTVSRCLLHTSQLCMMPRCHGLHGRTPQAVCEQGAAGSGPVLTASSGCWPSQPHLLLPSIDGARPAAAQLKHHPSTTHHSADESILAVDVATGKAQARKKDAHDAAINRLATTGPTGLASGACHSQLPCCCNRRRCCRSC